MTEGAVIWLAFWISVGIGLLGILISESIDWSPCPVCNSTNYEQYIDNPGVMATRTCRECGTKWIRETGYIIND